MLRFLMGLLALCTLLFGVPSLFVSTAMAQPSETCFTRALNGDVIDPPMCFVPVAHAGGSNEPPPTPPAPLPDCEVGDNPDGCHLDPP